MACFLDAGKPAAHLRHRFAERPTSAEKRPCHSGKAYEQDGRVTWCDKAHFPTYPLGLPTPVQGSHLVEGMYPS